MAQVTRLGLYGGSRGFFAFQSATAAVTVSGTVVTGGVLESEIVEGGQTIILTVANDTWVADDGTFASIRQDIIDGLDSAGSEPTGWNNEVRDQLAVSAVVRTSDTVVTITLTAALLYAIDADETITVTVPASALVAASSEVIGQQTFTVTAQAAQQPAGGTSRRKRRRIEERPSSDRLNPPATEVVHAAAPEFAAAVEQESEQDDEILLMVLSRVIH